MAAEVLATAGVDRHGVRAHAVRRPQAAARRSRRTEHHPHRADRRDACQVRRRPPTDSRGAIRAFGPRDLRSWCADLGETTFVGSTGQVFPASFRATPLLRAWLARLRAAGSDDRGSHRWLGLGHDARRRRSMHAAVASSHARGRIDVEVVERRDRASRSAVRAGRESDPTAAGSMRSGEPACESTTFVLRTAACVSSGPSTSPTGSPACP